MSLLAASFQVLGSTTFCRMKSRILPKGFLHASVSMWLKVFACGLTASMLVACGGGPKVPDWKKDSVNFIEKYKKAELHGEIRRADSYFEQALDAAGSAGQLGDAGRLHLVRCATRQASLNFGPCTGYLEFAGHGVNQEDEAYYRFLTNQWDKLDSSMLPAQYRNLLKHSASPGNVIALQAMTDPLSRLVAASVLVARKEADDALLNLAAETASEQGWRKPLLVYLKMMENRASLRNDKSGMERLRARIRLVEESL